MESLNTSQPETSSSSSSSSSSVAKLESLKKGPDLDQFKKE
jgi:hypothetical protein